MARLTKDSVKRASKANGPGVSTGQPSLSVSIGFRLPGWEQLPTSAPEGSAERQIWDDFGTKIYNLCLSEDRGFSGIITLDVSVPSAPAGFPEDFALQAASAVMVESAKAPGWETYRPHVLFERAFDEYGAVRIVGRFTPYDITVAQGGGSRHSDGQETIADAGLSLHEESSLLSSHSHHPDALTQRIEAVFAGVSQAGSVAALLEQLGVVNHEFRKYLAHRLAPVLNTHISQMPQETLDDKKAICDFVEKALEPLGLAVKVPNT
ncbi:hypothetical protein K2X33_16070, partial [bacterium]|nr:hypothetical protein [bacterium]